MRHVASSPLPISVIIPCYNDGEVLGEAVGSAVGSLVTEVIIVDDGSTDAYTRDVLEKYAGAGLTVLHMQNGGPAAARSRALQRVTTPYVFNLDADDELMPAGLGRLYDVLRDDPHCDVAWGDYRVFGEWDHVQETARCIDAWKLTLLNDMPVSALFRTEALRRVGGWQADGYEDWDLWMSCADHGMRGRHVPHPVFRYRTRPSAAMRGRTRDEFRHDVLLSEMRARHPALFDRRVRAWRRSCAPWSARIALPVASLVPLSGSRRVWFLWRTNQLSHGRFRSRLRHARRPSRPDVERGGGG
jgi:glycosyltransferase involved in cell wall biosynthesis